MHLLSGLAAIFALLQTAHADDLAPKLLSYTKGDPIPIQCLDRTVDTGEHITDPKSGAFQFVPFATCNETSAPLTLSYLDDTPINCTLASVSDEMYHLFEFYIHHDSPLSCRIPARPLGGEGALKAAEDWVPITFAIVGKLENSHLHIAETLNVVMHEEAGAIGAAAAYSSAPLGTGSKLIIGDPLALKLRVKWFTGQELGTVVAREGGGNTLFYCVLSALIGAGACYAWVAGVDVPRRLRRAARGGRGGDGIIGNFGGDKRGGFNGYGLPGNGGGGSGGYGYGVKRFD